MTGRHVVLAAMAGREHVQVGAPAAHDGAYALWAVLDGDLRAPHGRGERRHTIAGDVVRFYRVRPVDCEDITPRETVTVGQVSRAR
jgi:hypothetical protein